MRPTDPAQQNPSPPTKLQSSVVPRLALGVADAELRKEIRSLRIEMAKIATAVGRQRRAAGISEAELLQRLTPRDVEICLDIYDHRVLTSKQLTELHFTHPVVCRRRLDSLTDIGVLARFRPYQRPGSAPFHYLLGPVGIDVVAAAKGLEPKSLNYRRERLLSLASRGVMAHLMSVNTFFSSLTGACRRNGEMALVEWWCERRCAERWGDVIMPDGFGVVEGGSGRVSFFVEIDRGTEIRARLQGKVDRYEHLACLGDAGLVLFCFDSEGRERSIRRSMLRRGAPVATTTLAHHTAEPLGRVWWPLGEDGRASLMELGR